MTAEKIKHFKSIEANNLNPESLLNSNLVW